MCWYCGRAVLRTDDPPEHIIPDAMGGRLTTDRVCAQCNHRAGREIDGPFMRDMLIFWDRQSHMPGGAKMSPDFEAALDDGTPVDVRMDGRKAWSAKVRGSIERDDDQIRIRASDHKEYRRLLARLEKQLAAEGKSLPADLAEPEVEPVSGMINISSQVNGVVWLRMAAKITLSALSKVLDDGWLLTPDAAMYRGWLWDSKPLNADGLPALGFPGPMSDFDQLVNHPPEHLLVFHVLPRKRALLSISYYGKTVVRSAVDLAGHDMPSIAWRTWRGRPAAETSFDALLMEAALQVAEVVEPEEDVDEEDLPGNPPTELEA